MKSHSFENLFADSPSDAARIEMSDASVSAVLRQHFAGIDGAYIRPNVPGKRELAARSAHRSHLPSDERVLLLFDDNILSGGAEGFLITSRRVCWKNVGEPPAMIEWETCSPDSLFAERQSLTLNLSGAQSTDQPRSLAIQFNSEGPVIRACESAFHVLAFSARAALLAEHTDARASAAPSESGVDRLAPVSHVTNVKRNSDLPTLRPSRLDEEAHPSSHPVSYESCVVHATSQTAPSFGCWQCQAQLSGEAPHCMHCGAAKTERGWQQTG